MSRDPLDDSAAPSRVVGTIVRALPWVLLIAGVIWVAAFLFRYTPVAFFLGDLAVVASYITDSFYLDPWIGRIVAIAILLFVYPAYRLSRSYGISRRSFVGTAMILYSALAYQFSEPRLEVLENVTEVNCFGAFGEARCLVPVRSSGEGGASRLYRILSIYQIPRDRTLHARDGTPLRPAGIADVWSRLLQMDRVYSIQAANCFDISGNMSCAFKEVSRGDGRKLYVKYRLNRSFRSETDFPPLHDRVGVTLTLVTPNHAQDILQWERQNPDLLPEAERHP